jgi:hypothetical protein
LGIPNSCVANEVDVDAREAEFIPLLAVITLECFVEEHVHNGGANALVSRTRNAAAILMPTMIPRLQYFLSTDSALRISFVLCKELLRGIILLKTPKTNDAQKKLMVLWFYMTR